MGLWAQDFPLYPLSTLSGHHLLHSVIGLKLQKVGDPEGHCRSVQVHLWGAATTGWWAGGSCPGSGGVNAPERNTIPHPSPRTFFTSWKKRERKTVLACRKMKKLKAIHIVLMVIFFSARTQGVRRGGNLAEPTRDSEVLVWVESWRN